LGTDTVKGDIEQLHFLIDTYPDTLPPEKLVVVQLALNVPALAANGAFVNGTIRNDTINLAELYPTAGEVNDINAFGGLGNDIITGTAGRNYLSGQEGNDVINGGAGSDTAAFLLPGTTVGTLQSVFAADGATIIQLVNGSNVEDIYKVTRESGTLVVEGLGSRAADGRDVLTGIENLNFRIDTYPVTQPAGSELNINVATTINGNTLNGSNIRDVLEVASAFPGALAANQYNINGNAGPDLITGHEGINTLTGGDGNDVIDGLGGNDRLNGGAGNDTLTGGAGTDTVVFFNMPGSVIADLEAGTALSSDGDDTLIQIENIEMSGTTSHADTLRGDTNNNFLLGGLGADTLIGRDGNDTLIGGINSGAGLQAGDGADILEGDAGNDRLFGGDGNDVLRGGDGNDGLRGDAGNDIMDGGDGADFVTYLFNDLTQGRTIDFTEFAATTDFTFDDGRGGTDTVSNVEGLGITGTQGNDIINGSLHTTDEDGAIWANYLVGEGGNDTITGAGNKDRLDGGAGNDMLHGEGGDDFLLGGAGDDIINGGDGSDTAAYLMPRTTAGTLQSVLVNGATIVQLFKLDSSIEDIYRVTRENGTLVVEGLGSRATDGRDVLTGIESLNFRIDAFPQPAGSELNIYVETPTGPDLAATIELSDIADGASDLGFVIKGASVEDYSGHSVSSAGDVNGDGFDDLIVGAPGADRNGAASVGASYVVFGKANNTSVDLSAIASGIGGFVINGASADDRSGYSVRSAGDVDGDGYDDLIVGTPYASPSGNQFAGASYVVFGKTEGTQVDLSAIANGTSNLGFVINGASPFDRSGNSVSSAGDVNKDGYDDLIVGAYRADPTATTTDAGRSYVVFGKKDNTDAVDLSAIANGNGGFVINGVSANDFSGYSVSSAGDVNGDGFDDLIVGAPYASPKGSGSGASYVVFGKAINTAVNLSDIASGIGGFVISGASANDNSGGSVSSAGDVNGDGLDDLIVGASRADPNNSQYAGASYVVFGKTEGTQVDLSAIANGTSNLGFVINGASPFDRSGNSVSSAGDVNGDGFDDLIVGAPEATPNGGDSGASYVVFGKATNTAVDLQTIGTGGFVINGASANDFSGNSVSSAGDVNGDGFDDLIVGAPDADPKGSYSGASYVVFGGNFTGAVTQLGTSGNDTLSGTSGNDVIFGGLGNDIITTNGGNDRLSGGAGADTFVISDVAGTIRILDFGKGDTLDLRAFGLTEEPTFTKSGSGDTRIQLDADTSVIIEGYLPAQLTDLLVSPSSSSIVL
jgi:Ca2+-binding RTX toxin-like protein